MDEKFFSTLYILLKTKKVTHKSRRCNHLLDNNDGYDFDA